MNKKFYFHLSKELIHADLLVFKEAFVDKCINFTIWVVLTLGIMTYIMPYFGLADNFGPFQLGGTIAAAGLFELYSSVIDLVSDFEGDRVINYHFTLPMPSWLALISKAIYYAIIYFIIAVCVLPVGKIVLWNQLDLSIISYGKLFLALIFQSIFYAAFCLWAASSIVNMTEFGTVWSRYIFPMWFLGGFQFSWVSLYQVVPALALINLFNPMTYITESTRSALLGAADYINFWACLSAIAIFSALFLAWALRNLKKRLDFV